MNKFEKLNVYNEAHKLVLAIYKHTNKFPKSELFGLTSQIRRSAVSIVANTVEGNSRNSKKEYVQFLYIAIGSLEETKYHLLLAKDLSYITLQDYNNVQNQAENVGKMLNGLMKYWKNISHTS